MASIANRHKEDDSYGHQKRVFTAASVGCGNGEGGTAQHGRSLFVVAGVKPQLKNPIRSLNHCAKNLWDGSDGDLRLLLDGAPKAGLRIVQRVLVSSGKIWYDNTVFAVKGRVTRPARHTDCPRGEGAKLLWNCVWVMRRVEACETSQEPHQEGNCLCAESNLPWCVLKVIASTSLEASGEVLSCFHHRSNI